MQGTTYLFTISASSSFLPPMILMLRKHINAVLTTLLLEVPD